VVLNKVDLCPDSALYVADVEAVAAGAPVHAVSARERTGLEYLRGYLGRGKTAAFLGSSGAGKSALINALLGAEKQQTGAVRGNDHQGRHTTTRRELFVLPAGGVVIDTPGMRELQLWGGEDDLRDAFDDIAALSVNCRFHDCAHEAEPGCAVRSASAAGELNASRLSAYHKLQNELVYLTAKETQSVRLQEKLRWKKVAQRIKEIKKQKH